MDGLDLKPVTGLDYDANFIFVFYFLAVPCTESQMTEPGLFPLKPLSCSCDSVAGSSVVRNTHILCGPKHYA